MNPQSSVHNPLQMAFFQNAMLAAAAQQQASAAQQDQSTFLAALGAGAPQAPFGGDSMFPSLLGAPPQITGNPRTPSRSSVHSNSSEAPNSPPAASVSPVFPQAALAQQQQLMAANYFKQFQQMAAMENLVKYGGLFNPVAPTSPTSAASSKATSPTAANAPTVTVSSPSPSE
uniref:Uncharacterized protein n=1 Tax=Steinernema glaseri TaxID=37863 RepID=A0A1I7YRI6_9BILA